jgi:hypothetical protein
MGIDRIAGRPPGLAPQELGSGARTERAGAGFEVARPAEVPAAQPVPEAATALEQVRSGKIDVATYLDRKVEESTSHLSALPIAQLEAIRGALRDRLAADPSLLDLVQAATGQPSPPRDD